MASAIAAASSGVNGVFHHRPEPGNGGKPLPMRRSTAFHGSGAVQLLSKLR